MDYKTMLCDCAAITQALTHTGAGKQHINHAQMISAGSRPNVEAHKHME